jgi:hypothetical protein|tara:strand:+ start:2654 stop:2833 length:180 start_codon:yes stop_codon:yes gene_type:complete
MEKIFELLISAFATYGTMSILRDEQQYLLEIERLKNRLFFTRISLAVVCAAFGGFAYGI